MPVSEQDEAWVRQALALADRAAQAGDVPVGALVIGPDADVIGQGWNIREAMGDPTGHAEIVAMRDAAQRLGRWRLDGCTLVVTLEPCAMCAGAIVAARVPRVVFGAWDAKAGACGSMWDLVRDRNALHQAEVIAGVAEEDCRETLADFFSAHRL